MTIGPAPMMSTLLMSVRLGTLALVHQRCEAIEEITDVVRPRARLAAGPRVPRAVGQKYSVGLERGGFLCLSLRRENRAPTAPFHEHAQDVALDAVVVSDDVEAPAGAFAEPAAGLPPPLGPFVGLGGRHDLGQIHSPEPGKGPSCRQRPIRVV